MIRLLIVDDQKLLVDSLRRIIEQDDSFKVVGCAHNGREALELCNSLLPDVVLMDIKMPGCDGLEGTRLIKSTHPNIKVLILTMLDDDREICAAIENGADGYILKDITPDELKQAIKNVRDGFGVVSAKAYEIVRQQIGNRERKPDPKQLSDICLSDTEIQLIKLIADGKNNRQIAAALYLSEGRVKNIITDLLAKLELKSRYELLSFAYKSGLIA